MSDHSSTTVVGYDGSPASRAALAEGISRAGSDGHLVIVHAYEAPHDFVGSHLAQRALNVHRDHAGALMEALPQEFPELAEIDWEPDVVAGRPGDGICDAASAHDAREIIVGTRGRNPAPLLLGGVAASVIHLAECPVLVIPVRMPRPG